jgi:histone H3/H4
MDTQHKDRPKKKKTRFFETYISKVLKKVSESNGITSNSKQQLNSALCLISRIIAKTVITLTEMAKKKTMSDKEIKNALLIILPGQLASKAIIGGQNALLQFNNVNEKGTSRQEKAGILFSPAIAEKFLRNFGYSKVMVTSQAPVYLAGALEYLTSEILENASESAKDNKRIRINIRDLEMGVRNDTELNLFFTNNCISFLGGGVTPFIHPSLLVKKKRAKKVTKKDTDVDKKKHRFRPGTVCIREIRRFQKMSNCLTFAKFPFEKVVRQVVTNHNTTPMKISKDVFIVLQYFIEQQITSLLRNANFAAIHAGRVKLMPIDIDFIRSISTGNHNPYQKNSLQDISSIIDDPNHQASVEKKKPKKKDKKDDQEQKEDQQEELEEDEEEDEEEEDEEEHEEILEDEN